MLEGFSDRCACSGNHALSLSAAEYFNGIIGKVSETQVLSVFKRLCTSISFLFGKCCGLFEPKHDQKTLPR
jgi:hypothetical protein